MTAARTRQLPRRPEEGRRARGLEARSARPQSRHLVNTVQDLSARGVGLQVLAGQGAGGRKDGRKFALSKAQVRLAQAAMAHRDTSVSELCRELGIRPVTLYRYVGPQGQ